jgi:hypothetical protein
MARLFVFPTVRCRLYLEKLGLPLTIRPKPECSAVEYKKAVRSNNPAFDGVCQ